MPDINDYQPASGKMVKTDNSIVNKADGLNVDGSQNVQITGRKTQQIVIMNAVTVAAGQDYMTPSAFDLSQAQVLNYSYSTTGTGAGTTNTFLFSVETTGYKDALSTGTIQSNNGGNPRRPALVSNADLRGYNNIYFGFRNADSVAITVTLKAFISY